MPHKDPTVRRAYMRKWRRNRWVNDLEFRQAANKATVASRQTPDGARKHREANQRYKEKYPERVKGTMCKVDAMPHRVALRKRRNALKLGNEGKFTHVQWSGRCELYGNRCAYCNKPLLADEIEMDHVIPVVRGGPNWPSNLVPSCVHCNRKKHTSRWKPNIPGPRTDYFGKASGQSAPRLTVKES